MRGTTGRLGDMARSGYTQLGDKAMITLCPVLCATNERRDAGSVLASFE